MTRDAYARWRRACGRKRTYKRRKHANAAAVYASMSSGEDIQAYKCKYVADGEKGHFHIGHASREEGI